MADTWLSQNTLGALTVLGLCTQNSHSQAILRQPDKWTHDRDAAAFDELGHDLSKPRRLDVRRAEPMSLLAIGIEAADL